MKNTILTLVALLLVGTTSAFAQFSSTPVEPGLKDHLQVSTNAAVKVLGETHIEIDGIAADWVSPEQITLSADVIAVRRATETSLERLTRQIFQYNVAGPIGTLEMTNGTVRMIHHLNPRTVSPAEITRAVAVFKTALEEQRKNFDRSMAVR